MRDHLIRRLPLGLAAAAVLVLFAPLTDPSALFSVRDVPVFHLPLRTTFAELLSEGIPWWNPLIHGGQPILSNPNYAAFYPPTWLALLAPPAYAISLIVLLHAALAFTGAYRLCRRFGCGAAAASLAALAFAGGGGFASSANVLTMFCGLAWLPSILVCADAALGAEAGRPARRAGALTAAAFAAQFLAGEPVVVLSTGLAVACLALSRRELRRAPRLAAIAATAALLAAVQLLPTLHRLADSPRAEGLADTSATTWSMPPQRAVELLLPRFHGDPMRGDENLYFGWRVHDRQFPFLISIYPGHLVLILALAGLSRWPVARRGLWLLMLVVGLALALGRYNPLYSLLAGTPLLDAIRYPEKYMLLATSALALAGGVAWQHLLDRRRAGNSETADYPLALAIVAAVITATLALTLRLRPDLGEWFVRHNSLQQVVDSRLETAVGYLTAQAWLGFAVAAASVCVLLAHRSRRVPDRALIALTLLALGIDLGVHHRGLMATVPAATLGSPPELLARLKPDNERLFTDQAFGRESDLVLRSDKGGPDALWAQVSRLDPYVANLWGFAYALHEDYDLMLTDWARYPLGTLQSEWADNRSGARRLLGAWGVRYFIETPSVESVLTARLSGGEDPAARRRPNRSFLPLLRFPPVVTFHGDRDEALAAARDQEFRFARQEQFIDRHRLQEPGAIATSASDTRVHHLDVEAASLTIRYRASEATFLVIARTFDDGWRAQVDSTPVETYPTSAGQIGIALPPGEHELTLAYRDHRVTLGLTVTLLTALLALAACRYPVSQDTLRADPVP